jgi:hypothetical protein
LALTEIKPPARINILSYIGDTQGCGTIRIIYPHLLLPHLRKESYQFTGFYSAYFITLKDYYKNFTFVQFQRAATEQHRNLIYRFMSAIGNETKTPLIYEIDDLLTDIPDWNIAHDYYAANLKYTEEIMKMVNGITVSTEPLKRVYSKYNKNIEVIPNHLPKFAWGDIKPKHLNEPRTKKPRIIWAGSETHFAVIKGRTGGDFGDELIKFIRSTVDKYQWVIITGTVPPLLADLKNKIEFHRWKNIFDYPAFIKGLDVDFGIAPLHQCLFNDCKSNIKMLEYVATGIPAVYSKIEPYKNAHLQSVSDSEIISHIESLAKDVDLRKTAWEKDHQAVKNQLWWEDNDYRNLKQYVNSYLKLFGKTIPF